eukprot:CAMPEP_0195055778 /NCGR_PEP_ID=MMETSP0448-20130528/4384_1 /TAXON_ID=66468 /ORGANISM="Heterocapsa triquestra, Strain CCMP 448" /LENGTH=44 /DNA_ID= /DNA_START= /DNA_END= /DNA_ORIENTATION=
MVNGGEPHQRPQLQDKKGRPREEDWWPNAWQALPRSVAKTQEGP